jgi:hypothetical protein
MQPAYYEDFTEIKNKIWSMLDNAIKDRSSPFRIPALAFPLNKKTATNIDKNSFFIIIIFINILNNSTLKKPKIGFLLFKI